MTHKEAPLDLAAYMSNSIRNIMTTAYKNVLSNPREAKFAFTMQRIFEKSEKRRVSSADKRTGAASPRKRIPTEKNGTDKNV